MKRPIRPLTEVAEEGGLCDPREVASYLQISLPMVYFWAKTGRLPGVKKIGPQALRFDARAVKAFVDGLEGT